MKKTIKNIALIILCLSMVICMAVPSSAAGSNTEYISELRVESGTNGEACKQLLINAGYKVLEADINADSKVSTYIGYKTTTDPQKAITDIKVMNMNGKYSYTDYDVMLKKQKAAIEESIDALTELIEEFRTNYEANDLTAVNAYEALNRFYNDDVQMYMGDFLLECELQAGKRDELSTVFLQGNSELILAIQQALALGSDSLSNTFLDRLQAVDYDSMVEDYTEEYGSRKAAVQQLALDYDDAATRILDSWDDFNYTLQKIKLNNSIVSASEEEVKSLSSSMEDGEFAVSFIDSFIYSYLESIEYGESTMLDYFSRNSEDVDIEEIYPLVASLSKGQRDNLSILSLYTLVECAIMEQIADEKAKQGYSDFIKEMPTVSVYSGVDRQLFNGGVALTSEATDADARSSSGGWQKPFEAAERYYWAIGLVTVVSIGTYIATTQRISSILSKMTAAKKITDGEVQVFINILTKNDVMRAKEAFASKSANFITRRFNYGVGYSKISTSLVNMHRVAFVFSIVTVFVNAALLGYEIHKLIKDEDIEYVNIPLRMVNYVSDDKSGHYIKYDCATSVNGVCSDTNSYTKDEWLALYYTNDAQAGKPIKASSLEVLSSKTIPTGKTPVTLFNEGALYNLSTMSKQESYLVFEQDNASLTGSVFSSSTYAICFGISVVAAFAVSFLVVTMVKKKKTNQ